MATPLSKEPELPEMPRMTESIAIRPSGPIRGSIRPPGSKSITNRALVCAALAEGTSTLQGALASEDTQVMVDSLRRLGLWIDHDPRTANIQINGCSGRLPMSQAEFYIANSGTSMRFLTAMLTLGHGVFRIDGTPRMRQRPIQDLLTALGQLGARAASQEDNACPPVILRAAGLPGGRAMIAGSVSSQFLSGLLMAAPYADQPVELLVTGELVSKPYVDMTLAVMQSFGASAQAEGYQRFLIPKGRYRACHYFIEPDASAASYFFAAAAITRGRVTVRGLSAQSLQGDVAFCRCLEQMGCEVEYGTDAITVVGRPLRGIEANMNAISDTAQTLAAVALFAEGRTAITGVGHIRHKETDRIAALAIELAKFGADVQERDDGLLISPCPLHGATIDTYDDHRMAMSLALVGLSVPGVVIRDPQCTAKTYPGFFTDLARLANS